MIPSQGLVAKSERVRLASSLGRNAGEGDATPPNAEKGNWSSYKGLTVDTLAHRGDEGRGYLR